MLSCSLELPISQYLISHLWSFVPLLVNFNWAAFKAQCDWDSACRFYKKLAKLSRYKAWKFFASMISGSFSFDQQCICSRNPDAPPDVFLTKWSYNGNDKFSHTVLKLCKLAFCQPKIYVSFLNLYLSINLCKIPTVSPDADVSLSVN